MKKYFAEQMEKMRSGKGFIAALDQSGGSTPKALENYGIPRDAYQTEEEMFDLVHQMRTRIITNPAFSGDKILGAILFENTMNRTVEGKPTALYLWEEKRIVPFLKVDRGLAEKADGVQIMKPMEDLMELLDAAEKNEVFGTKMRSVIHEANEAGIKKVVSQQFEIAQRILDRGFIPIIEPEVNIHCPDKVQAENILKAELEAYLETLKGDLPVIFKLTLPEEANLYKSLMAHPRVLRVVALSGGYSRAEAVRRLAENEGMIASFSRALTEGLSADQSDEAFTETLRKSIEEIYQASLT